MENSNGIFHRDTTHNPKVCREPQKIHFLPISADNIFLAPWSTGFQINSTMEGQKEGRNQFFALFLFALGSLRQYLLSLEIPDPSGGLESSIHHALELW